MKILRNILIGLVVLVAGLLILKDVLIKSAITTVGSNVLGAPIKVGSFHLGLIRQKVHIKNLVVSQPKGYPEGAFVDVPEVRVDYDLGALIGGKLHLPMVVFNLKEVVLIKDQEGRLNVDALKVAQAKEAPKGETKEEAPAKKEKGEAMPMQIDELKLNIGRVVMIDHSQGEMPVITAFETPLQDKTFKDIKSAQQLATLVMVQAMGPAGIKSAAIYGAATVLGVAFLPAGVVGVLVGNDSSTVEYKANFDQVYDAGLSIVKEYGELKSEDRGSGVIKAKLNGCDVAIKLEKTPEQKIKVDVSARKMMLPKSDIAGGIQYLIGEKL